MRTDPLGAAYLDNDRRRELVHARYEAALPIANFALFVEQVTAEILDSHDVDLPQIVYDLVATDAREYGRQKANARRNAEVIHHGDGSTAHIPFEQLTIPQAEEVARRKIRIGEAALRAGAADLLVVNAATVAAFGAGLSLVGTTIEQVLSAAEIADLRGEAKAA